MVKRKKMFKPFNFTLKSKDSVSGGRVIAINKSWASRIVKEHFASPEDRVTVTECKWGKGL